MHSSTKIPDRRPRVRTRFIVHPDGTITPEFVSVARVAAGDTRVLGESARLVGEVRR